MHRALQALPAVPLVAILLRHRARRGYHHLGEERVGFNSPSTQAASLLASSFLENVMTSTAILPSMERTFRIKECGTRQLFPLVDHDADHRIATSETFDTICMLESGLAVLLEAAKSPESVVVERDAEVTSLGSAAPRTRVRFRGRLDDDGVRELLQGAMTATLIDERPNGQRRADLSGRLCELGH